MPTIPQQLAEQPPAREVIWYYSEDDLQQNSLPIPEIENNSYLVSGTDALPIKAGIVSLPPKEHVLSRFWSGFLQRIRGQANSSESIPPVGMRINKQIEIEQARAGEHTPLSILYPYVVLEDKSLFGIRLQIPSSLVGPWSGELQRHVEDEDLNPAFKGILKPDRTIVEKYIQRKGVAFHIRLNGEESLIEQEVRYTKDDRKIVPEVRTAYAELFSGPSSQADRTGSYIGHLATRKVLSPAKRQGATFGPDVQKSKVSDSEFTIVAERGSEQNRALGKLGLIEIIVSECINEMVYEREITEKPLAIPQLGNSFQESHFFGDATIRGINPPNSTVAGKIGAANTRTEKVQFGNVVDPKPIARFRFALVGNGGPIIEEMAEAPDY